MKLICTIKMFSVVRNSGVLLGDGYMRVHQTALFSVCLKFAIRKDLINADVRILTIFEIFLGSYYMEKGDS